MVEKAAAAADARRTDASAVAPTAAIELKSLLCCCVVETGDRRPSPCSWLPRLCRCQVRRSVDGSTVDGRDVDARERARKRNNCVRYHHTFSCHHTFSTLLDTKDTLTFACH